MKEGEAMSEERLFYVERNDSWHSYEFLARRQHDPKWRQAFIEADALLEREEKKKKRRNFIILLVSVPVVVLGMLVGLYFYGSAGEEAIPQRALSLTEATSSTSTVSAEPTETQDTSSVGEVLVTPWGEHVTVLRVLSNGQRVIQEAPSPSDLNNDGVLTYEELSRVEEEANQQYQQPVTQQGQPNQQQTPQQTVPSQSQQQPNSQPASSQSGVQPESQPQQNPSQNQQPEASTPQGSTAIQ